MENITSITELKKAIQLLEVEQAYNGELLKEQFFLTYESLKPLNLLRSTIKDVASSPWLIENILGTALSLTTGYVSKKIVIGASGNIFRRFLGSVMQFGVTNVVAQNQESIKSFGQVLYNKFFSKKEYPPTQEE